ncbi:hypothetical protein, conserved [Eimeria maxima]|uniref:Uncharacterized protein n=1 Tax=Eimeria maxima TaxID=5804 RepID=U6M1S6_EIMMA|nr:hypothetical protein, conserved [Eimeria maxima]CDJ57018.1 hypothetical protein, conserved [Eimeria maxima]
MAQSRAPRRLKRSQEAQGERLGAQQMRPTSPTGDKRGSLGDSKTPQLRALSSKSTPRGKAQRESAVPSVAKKAVPSPEEGPQTPRNIQQATHDNNFTPGSCLPEVPSLCPPSESIQQPLCPSPSVQCSAWEESPHREHRRGTGLTPDESMEANLQKKVFELMRQNSIMRRALLKHISSEELLFLLAYNTTRVTSEADDELRDTTHTSNRFTSEDALAVEQKSCGGSAENSTLARNIDLPCVQDFFKALRYCSGPAHEAPPVSEGAPVAAAEDSAFLHPPMSREEVTATNDADGYFPIAVDFDPFGLQKDDDSDTHTTPVGAESHRSTMSSSTISTNLQQRSVEGGFRATVPAPPVGLSAPQGAARGSLEPALSPVKPRAPRGSMFYPSTYRLAALLPQTLPNL